MEEKNTKENEVNEEKEVKTEKPASAYKTDAKNRNFINLVLMACAAVIIVMIFFQSKKNNDNDACIIVGSSAFGQAQSQVWVDLESRLQNKGIAGFDLEVPKETDAYENIRYRAYSYQVNEVIFQDEDSNPVIRIDKAKYCGKDILETDNERYNTINKIEVGDVTVTERGANDLYTAISWVKGDFSYGIVMYNDGLTEAEVESYVSQIE